MRPPAPRVTSMPRSYLLQARFEPERDQTRGLLGAHDATIAAVAAGKVDAGALNISVWEKFVAEGKVDSTKLRVFYTTPSYFDYNWTVHADMPAAQREKLAQAFLRSSTPARPRQEIPGLQRHALHPHQSRELPGHRAGRAQCRFVEIMRAHDFSVLIAV